MMVNTRTQSTLRTYDPHRSERRLLLRPCLIEEMKITKQCEANRSIAPSAGCGCSQAGN